MYIEFQVPSDDQLLRVLGVEPHEGDEVGVRHLDLRSTDGYDVRVTADALGRSFFLRVERDGAEMVRIERELATLMVVAPEAPEIVVEFQSGDTKGSLLLELDPRLRIRDSTLRI